PGHAERHVGSGLRGEDEHAEAAMDPVPGEMAERAPGQSAVERATDEAGAVGGSQLCPGLEIALAGRAEDQPFGREHGRAGEGHGHRRPPRSWRITTSPGSTPGSVGSITPPSRRPSAMDRAFAGSTIETSRSQPKRARTQSMTARAASAAWPLPSASGTRNQPSSGSGKPSGW